MITVIDDQPDFLVVAKPAGVSFHDSHSAHETQDLSAAPVDSPKGITQGFFNQLKHQTQRTLFPVHRLDALTSGLLICAKHKTAAAQFGELFEKHQIQKYYLAISDGKPKKKQGLIKGDMEKTRKGNWKLTQSTTHPALTQFFSCSVSPGVRLFLIKPLTGRTHQIRVALKSIGSPIIGDARYHNVHSMENPDRGYLHAYALVFEWRGSAFHYRLPPTEGELFNQENCLGQLNGAYSEPWNLDWPKI